jgi:hypothetical protein
VRGLVDRERIEELMRRLGAVAAGDAECFLAGGATAVLLGWRASTIDVDLHLVPERDEVLRAIPFLKDELRLNIELAWPGDFIPLPEGGGERAIYAGREGKLTFRHADPYAQALAKIERGHARDLEDIAAMGEHGLIEPERLLELFVEIESELFRFPAIDAPSYRRAVESAVSRLRDSGTSGQKSKA